MQLTRAAGKARRDNISSLRTHIIPYMITMGIPCNLADLDEKGNRGWKNVATGRLLSPRRLRDEYDANNAQ